MAIRSSADYIESLRDGRDVWLGGEPVQDVPTHPAFRGCVNSVGELYDMERDPAYADLLMFDPGEGERYLKSYCAPHSAEDLIEMRRMIELIARFSGGTLARSPEYVPLVLLGLLAIKDDLGRIHPAYAANLDAYTRWCRDNNLALSHSFTDPIVDRSRPESADAILRVVDRRPEGMVVRGVRAVATFAPQSHEILCIPAPAPNLSREQVIYFALPVNTPGIRLICRDPLGLEPDRFDHPLSSRFDEIDALVEFRDVLVPHDRIFFMGEVADVHRHHAQFLAWAHYHVLVRLAVKAEVFIGLIKLAAQYAGTAHLPHVNNALARAITYATILHGMIHTAESAPVFTPSSFAAPNPAAMTAGRLYGIEHYEDIVTAVRQVTGYGLLTAPTEADLASEALGAALRHSFTPPSGDAEERIRLLRLGWDLVGSGFGGRQAMFELFNAGSPARLQGLITLLYDSAPATRLVQDLAHGRLPPPDPSGLGE
jgi:aromatic ring hydroxylase